MGELSRGWRCPADLSVERNVLTEETDPVCLLQHPSPWCVFHLFLVGCCALADYSAEIKGFIGRTQDAMDAKGNKGEMSIPDATEHSSFSFIPHVSCKIIMEFN